MQLYMIIHKPSILTASPHQVASALSTPYSGWLPPLY